MKLFRSTPVWQKKHSCRKHRNTCRKCGRSVLSTNPKSSSYANNHIPITSTAYFQQQATFDRKQVWQKHTCRKQGENLSKMRENAGNLSFQHPESVLSTRRTPKVRSKTSMAKTHLSKTRGKPVENAGNLSFQHPESVLSTRRTPNLENPVAVTSGVRRIMSDVYQVTT